MVARPGHDSTGRRLNFRGPCGDVADQVGGAFDILNDAASPGDNQVADATAPGVRVAATKAAALNRLGRATVSREGCPYLRRKPSACAGGRGTTSSSSVTCSSSDRRCSGWNHSLSSNEVLLRGAGGSECRGSSAPPWKRRVLVV